MFVSEIPMLSAHPELLPLMLLDIQSFQAGSFLTFSQDGQPWGNPTYNWQLIKTRDTVGGLNVSADPSV